MDNFFGFNKSRMFYNKLDYSNFSAKAFNAKYKVVTLNCKSKDGSKSFVKFDDEIFEYLKEDIQILAVSYDGGNKVHLLLDKNSNLNLEKYKGNKKFDFWDIDIYIPKIEDDIKLYNSKLMGIVMNLLLINLNKKDNNASNVDGKLYIYVKKVKDQIITMKYFIRNGCLRREQQSFIPYKDSLQNKKKTKYKLTYGQNNTIVRIKSNEIDMSNLYVKGSYKKVEISADYLQVNKSKKTRVALLHELQDNFNAEYEGIAKLEFCKVDAGTKKIISNETMKKQKREKMKFLGKVNIVLHDNFNDNLEKIELFEEYIHSYGLEVQESDIFIEDMLNIAIIHNKEYYKSAGIEDVKLDFPKDKVIQSITFETIEEASIENIPHLADKIICELYNKEQLKNRKIDDWNFGECEFYLAIVDKKQLGKWPKHYLMKVKDNGIFEIIEDANIIGVEYTKHSKILINRYKKDHLYKDGCVYIVKKGNDINRIEHTDYMPIVDRKSLRALEMEAIEAGKKTRSRKELYLQDKLKYPHVWKTILFIDGYLHYTIGLGSNFQPNISKLNNIYKIVQIEGNLIKEILDMLEYNYIRTDRAESVRPYPFKFLMEYVRIQNPGKDLYLRD